ncbi:helix-turn-helix domain-containing protein [Demequina maris]|uniref:helix-turn-helix domain-containing protein n=1 Tax=Demequina maris TaxID=1638982 RepID=UPI00155A6552|nr:helix-turn-helix transcriptional regulator [Demequina maris]
MPPKRLRPRDLTEVWPDSPVADAVGEVARRVALALHAAIGESSLREVAARTGVDHTTVADVLNGTAWPDTITLARLEIGLGVALWPADYIAEARHADDTTPSQ